MCALDADGAAAMENLRAELARAKEQTRKSDAAAGKAIEELNAEQAAHCRSKKEMAEMAVKLKFRPKTLHGSSIVCIIRYWRKKLLLPCATRGITYLVPRQAAC